MKKEKVYSLVSIETIEKAKQGDTESFTQIYKEYHNKIYFIAKYFCKDDNIAYDILQETFVKVYRKISTLDDAKYFHAWIQKVAYHECLNHDRKMKKYVFLGEENDFDDFQDEKQQDISEIIENNRVMEEIMKSLESMSLPLKSVGILRYHEGLAVNEIAEVLEVPRGTVCSRLNRVKQLLRNDLKKQGVSPKNYAVIVLSPGVLHYAYSVLSNKYTENLQLNIDILNKVLKNGGFLSGIAMNIKFALSAVTVITVTVGAGALYNYQPNELEKPAPITIEKPAIAEEKGKIKDISYDKNWTRNDIVLDVTTTNDNYDHIEINNIESLSINDNGEYLIQLVKDEEVIDEQTLSISNIDRKSPNGYCEKNGDIFKLYLYDDLSNINPEQVYLYRDGVLSNEYSFNQSSNELIVNSPQGVSDLFYIYDYAGNELKIIVE